MKIRHPRLIRALGSIGTLILRGWLQSLKFRYIPVGANYDPRQPGGLRQNCIYAFWHEYLILPCRYAHPDVYVLISHHADGEVIARMCKGVGLNVVRGSTSRGGLAALWEMLRLGEAAHLAITPDGPRGPRRRVQSGLVYLASRSGMPVVPLGIGYRNPWRMKSWDRFAVPRPFDWAIGLTADPIYVPAMADRSGLENYRLTIEMEINRLCTIAQDWADKGSWPGSSAERRRVYQSHFELPLQAAG